MAGSVDRDRLARILGMLGSAHDGEVVAAARQAERLRQDAGLIWRDIVGPAASPPALRPHGGIDTMIAELVDGIDWLSA
jgi:hypothetical protein